MKPTRTWMTAVAALSLLAAAASVCLAATPTYTLIEAEADPHGLVKKDPAASGGAYVEQTGGYQPMMIAPLPETGSSWVLWARIRDVSLQLKGVQTNGSQKELNWEWDQPSGWTWISFGRHTRAELGAKALLVRGPNAGPHPGLDAIVFAAEDAFNPNTGIVSPPVVFPPVTITINWKASIAQATPLSYGLNAYAGFDPAVTQNAAYQSNMARMRAGILRLHNWGMMGDSRTDASGWVDMAHQCWDGPKIKKALTGAYAYGPTLLINIPGWPSWMDKDKNDLLDADQTQAYAQLCAQLAKIVNKDLGCHVAYWEVTNERDGPYYGDFHNNGGLLKDSNKPDHLADLAAIYNLCAVAMKAVDPTIKVGGPSVARPDWTDFVTRFVTATMPHLDFFSYHAYASGSKDDTDRQIFDRAGGFGDATKQIVAILKTASPNRSIPAVFDEYNISWAWETRDPRMTDIKGAVFDALAITSTTTNGAGATLAWNERDGVYGKMDNDYHLRPSATLFRWLNTRMLGTVVSTVSNEPSAVVGYAVRRTNGQRALLLINRSPYNRVAAPSPWSGKTLKQYQLTDTGLSPVKFVGRTIPLPADSVTILYSEVSGVNNGKSPPPVSGHNAVGPTERP